jgi:hypothetical protein
MNNPKMSKLHFVESRSMMQYIGQDTGWAWGVFMKGRGTLHVEYNNSLV